MGSQYGPSVQHLTTSPIKGPCLRLNLACPRRLCPIPALPMLMTIHVHAVSGFTTSKLIRQNLMGTCPCWMPQNSRQCHTNWAQWRTCAFRVRCSRFAFESWCSHGQQAECCGGSRVIWFLVPVLPVMLGVHWKIKGFRAILYSAEAHHRIVIQAQDLKGKQFKNPRGKTTDMRYKGSCRIPSTLKLSRTALSCGNPLRPP